MDKQELDVRRIFILAVLLFLMFTGYQIYFFYFVGKGEAQKEQVKETKGEDPESVPSLMLGTSRESYKPQNVHTFDFPNFRIRIAEEGGRVVSLVDKEYNKELITDVERKLNLYPLEIYSGNPEIDAKLNFSTYRVLKDGDSITMILEDEGLKVVKKITYKGNYFELGIESPVSLYVSTGVRVKEDSFFTHEGPIFKINGSVVRYDIEDVKGKEFVDGNISFAGEESRYYFKGFSGDIKSLVIYRLEGDDTVTLVKSSNPLIFYAGSKEYSRLKDLGLDDVIDYGTLKIFVKPLFIFMYWIYEHLGSWTFSILALTLIVRILTFPLTYKSTVSMARLSEIAPKIQQLKEKYKDDPVKMQEEMMKLYSEVGFNPMSGCLPILLQIPIFFALYKVLTITADLQLASFLWVTSLSQKDPYYVLPILMGATMILQQFITPNPDKSQNLIMYVSAIAFTFLFASFPAGLVLYWTFSNVINIVQNYIIKKMILKEKPKPSKRDKKKKK